MRRSWPVPTGDFTGNVEQAGRLFALDQATRCCSCARLCRRCGGYAGTRDWFSDWTYSPYGAGGDPCSALRAVLLLVSAGGTTQQYGAGFIERYLVDASSPTAWRSRAWTRRSRRCSASGLTNYSATTWRTIDASLNRTGNCSACSVSESTILRAAVAAARRGCYGGISIKMLAFKVGIGIASGVAALLLLIAPRVLLLQQGAVQP